MSTATADMLSIERRTSPYGPRVIPITETESEVMPNDNAHRLEESSARCGGRSQPRTSDDTRPASATRADPLAEIATLVRQITYGEMIELAAALWRNRSDDAPVTQEALPGILHRWSSKP